MKDLTKGHEAKAILVFAIPMILGNLLQQFYNLVDTYVVGLYVGSDAFAAVGTAFPLFFLLIAFIAGLTGGMAIIASQLYGAKRFDSLKRAISTMYILSASLGVVMTLVGTVVAEPVLKYVLAVPDSIIGDTLAYVRILLGAMVFMFIYNGLAALLRALGDSRTPLYFLMLSTVINIGLDVLFVAQFGWGVQGVGWATFIANVISALSLLIYVYVRNPYMRVTPKNAVFDPSVFKQSLRLGVPTGIQQTLFSLGIIMVQRLVNTFGVDTMSAFTAGSRIEQIATMPIMNLQMALATFVGQNIGAGLHDRAERGFKMAQKIMVFSAMGLGVLLVLFGDVFIRLLVPTGNDAVFAQGASYLRVTGGAFWFFCIGAAITGLLRGSGDVIIGTISTSAAFAVRLSLAYILALNTPLAQEAIWLSMPVGWTVSLLIVVFRYRSGAWKRINILHEIRADDAPMLGT